MKKFLILILSVQQLTGQAGNNPSITADEVLSKVSANLNNCHSVYYLYERDYYTGEQHYITRGYSYIDFSPADSIINLRSQVVAGELTYVFNGSESFILNKKNKTLTVKYKPGPYDIEGGSFFYNSLVSLRRTLPLIIGDRDIAKSLQDTSIGNTAYYMVGFSLHKKTLSSYGGYSPVIEDRTFSFRLLVSKDSFLPYMLLQRNNADEHSSKVTYSDIRINTTVDEKSWYYSSYQPAFNMVSSVNGPVVLPPGFDAPVFDLPFYETGTMVHSKDYKGKVLLLEFWIRNCGPCIESVPKLNSLLKNYDRKDLGILAVNAFDKKPVIDFFVNRYKPGYSIAVDGENVSKAFGVSGFPTVFVISKKGRILYSGFFDYDAIVAVIEKAIHQ